MKSKTRKKVRVRAFKSWAGSVRVFCGKFKARRSLRGDWRLIHEKASECKSTWGDTELPTTEAIRLLAQARKALRPAKKRRGK